MFTLLVSYILNYTIIGIEEREKRMFLSPNLIYISFSSYFDKVAPAKKLGGTSGEVKGHVPSSSKPLKEKTTKAERRALQEAQRAAKVSAKGTNLQ